MWRYRYKRSVRECVYCEKLFISYRADNCCGEECEVRRKILKYESGLRHQKTYIPLKIQQTCGHGDDENSAHIDLLNIPQEFRDDIARELL